MKTLIYATLAASVLAAPVVAFAQDSNAPVTRAEVRADLVRLEQAGYQPGMNDAYYPADIQAAEARVQAQENGAPANTSAGGVPMTGSSQSDSATPAVRTPSQSIYGGQ
jgi:hypothetical protein